MRPEYQICTDSGSFVSGPYEEYEDAEELLPVFDERVPSAAPHYVNEVPGGEDE